MLELYVLLIGVAVIIFNSIFFYAILYELQEIKGKEVKIIMKLDEVAGVVRGVKDQVDKAKAEILAKIASLETSLANVELPVDATVALDELKLATQAIDDIVPDV